MPCYDDGALTQIENGYTKVAELTVYVLEKLGKEVGSNLLNRESTDYVLRREARIMDSQLVPNLCSLLKSLTPQEIDSIVYDGKNRTSRELANWWEDHQEFDKKREGLELDKIDEKAKINFVVKND